MNLLAEVERAALAAWNLPEVLAAAPAWVSSPEAFARDCIDWSGTGGLTAYQAEILAAIAEYHRAAVRGPHGLGKTTVNALAVLWFACSRDWLRADWKVATTAGAWRQLEFYLWPEIRKWAKRIRWDVVGRGPFNERSELLTLTIKLASGSAFAVASDNPALIEGVHADFVLYIFDESKAIIPATFDAAEGAFSGANGESIDAYALAFSTPGEPSGRFYEIHTKREGLEDWWTRHVTVEEAITAGRISREWVDARRRQWGENSALFANRVLGEFHTSDEAGVIPLSWIEAAVERWKAWKTSGAPLPPLTTVGVDVARYGSDQTVMAPLHGHIIDTLRYTRLEGTMETAGRAEGILRGAGGGKAIVDVLNMGAGVVDKLRENDVPVDAFNAGEGTRRLDRSGELGFVNCRSAAWWNLREMLDPAFAPTLALPDDDLLLGDLTAPHWRVASGGRIQIETKDEIKKRIGRSTDSGDAVMQAVWPSEYVPSPRRMVVHVKPKVAA